MKFTGEAIVSNVFTLPRLAEKLELQKDDNW